jgi:hypothetical protein
MTNPGHGGAGLSSVAAFVFLTLALSVAQGPWLSAPAKAEDSCAEETGERYRAEVEIDTPRPRLDHSRYRAELTQGFHGGGGRILGVHASGIRVTYAADFATEPYDSGYCFWVRSVKVRLSYQAPDIYIAKNYPVGSCQYQAILAHELTHEAVARKVMKLYAPRFDEALISLLIPKSYSAVVVSSREEARRETNAVLAKLIEPVYLDFRRYLDAAQSQVDSPRQYAKVRAKCSKW